MSTRTQTRTAATSWLWLLSLFTAASFLETFFWGQVGAFTPLHLPALGVAAGEIAGLTGLIASLSSVVGIPFLPFWGALADRYARQPVIVRSFIALLLAALVMALADNVWLFVLGRSLMSLALGNSGLMLTTLSEHAPANRHGLAYAIMNSAAPVGYFVGPLLGGALLDRYGFRWLMGLNAVLMLALALAMAFGYRDAYRGKPGEPLLKMALDSVGIIGRVRRLRVLFPALVVLFAGWSVALTYAPLAITALAPGRDPGATVGLVVGAGGIAALLIGPLLGALSDRFGLWRVLFAGALLETALMPLPALARSVAAFGAAWALLSGVASGVFALSFNALSTSAAPRVRGRVMSFAYLPLNLGTFVGPAIGSLVARSALFAIFPAAAGLVALSILMLYGAYRQPVEA